MNSESTPHQSGILLNDQVCPACFISIDGQTLSSHLLSHCHSRKQAMQTKLEKLLNNVKERARKAPLYVVGSIETRVKLQIEKEAERRGEEERERERFRMELQQPQICPICYESLNDEAIDTLCLRGHFMHQWCISHFIENTPKHKKCPICREDIEHRLNSMKRTSSISTAINQPTLDGM